MSLDPLFPPSRFETIIIDHQRDPRLDKFTSPQGHEHYERKNAFVAPSAASLVAIHRAGFVVAPARLRRLGGDHCLNGTACWARRLYLILDEPAGAARRDDEIDLAAAAFRANEPAAPGTGRSAPCRSACSPGSRSAMRAGSPCTRRAAAVRPGRAAERRRTRFAFLAAPSHIRGMSDRTPDDKAGEGAKRPVMTRSELIRRLADANPTIHQLDIADAVEVLFAEIAAGLARGDRVELRGFGTFTPKTRRARVARNPRTGAAVEVGEKELSGFPRRQAAARPPEPGAGRGRAGSPAGHR